MAAVYYGRRSVGEFSQCGRQAVAITHGSHEVDEGISLPRMVGQQPDGIDHKSFQKIQRIFWRGSCLRNHTASGGAGFNAHNRRNIFLGNGFSPTSGCPTTCPKWMFTGDTWLVDSSVVVLR